MLLHVLFMHIAVLYSFWAGLPSDYPHWLGKALFYKYFLLRWMLTMGLFHLYQNTPSCALFSSRFGRNNHITCILYTFFSTPPPHPLWNSYVNNLSAPSSLAVWLNKSALLAVWMPHLSLLGGSLALLKLCRAAAPTYTQGSPRCPALPALLLLASPSGAPGNANQGEICWTQSRRCFF